MFFTYLRRELLNRRRQTLIVSVGLAIGIALVSTVSAISTGVKDSQQQVLNSLYGIRTDITITQRGIPIGGPPRFDVGSEDGSQSGGVQTISRTQLRTMRGAITFDDATVKKLTEATGVASVATALKLSNTTFEGELPTFMGRQGGGGADGRGGSAFTVIEFSVLGITGDKADVGPMASVELTGGRLLTPADAGRFNVVVDLAYASTEGFALQDTIAIADKVFMIVGIVGPTAGAAETASNTYIPIDVARSLANVETGVTNVYVKIIGGEEVSNAAAALSAILPDATVSTSSDLAKTVSGSLSTASDLLSNFGKWLSVIVLIVAFVLAMLFTTSGVTRRTREFGTLKALGWRSSKIVRQVMAETAVQGALGGLMGGIIAFGAVEIVNTVAPTLEASPDGGGFVGMGPFGANPFGANPFAASSQSTIDIVLQAEITASNLAVAIALAVLGGLLAGAVGGMRAARLRPAESLRSVA